MTLKPLNARYVKIIAVIGVGLMLVSVSLLSSTCWGAQASSAVTPLFVNEEKLTASDGAPFDEFGNSVAFSGSTIVVGAPDTVDGNPDPGSAYVFNRQGGGWVDAQKLTASDRAADDLFGWSVAISGSTIVVGAWGDDIGGNADQGSVYVFTRQGENWVETQKLTASDAVAHDRFGWSVAISGSTIVVGAQPDRIGSNLFQEPVYVFNRQEGSWVEEQRLIASDGGRFDEFGWSVAVSGSTIVVSAIRSSFQGAAYVFTRQGGSWVEEQKLTPSDGEMFDEFGWSVAVSGSTIVISAISTNHLELQGAAWVFTRQGEEWVEEQKLTPSDGLEFDEFGYSVAISGSTIVVASPGDDPAGGGNFAHGSAYIFTRQGKDWVETQKLTASDGGAADFFGTSVAINGSTVVVSARGDTIGTNFGQGSAYVFNRQRGKI